MGSIGYRALFFAALVVAALIFFTSFFLSILGLRRRNIDV